MKNLTQFQTKDEVTQKLNTLYPDNENDYESDLGYQFFSKSISTMLQFSSQWFDSKEPKETKEQNIEYENVCENGIEKKFAVIKQKEEPAKTEPNMQTGDLKPLEKLSYLEINGEKFRVVSATLQKCSSPGVRRTFNFTPNGIIETPTVPKFKKIQPIKMLPNQKFIINKTLPTIRVNQPVPICSKKTIPIRLNDSCAKENTAPKVTIFRREESKSFVTHKICGDQSRKIIILRKRIPLKPRQENSKRQPEVIVLDDKSEKKDDFEVKQEPVVPEDIARCSSPSTDTGDEEILPENIMEEPEEKIIKTEPYVPEPFKCGECGEIFSSFQEYEEHTATHKKVPDLNAEKAPGKVSRENRKSKSKLDSHVIMATSKFGRTRRVLNIAQLHKNYGVL